MVKYVLSVVLINIGILKVYSANIVKLGSTTIYRVENVNNVLKKSQFYKMEYVIHVHKEHIIKIKYVLNVVTCNIGIILLKHVNLVGITYSIIN